MSEATIPVAVTTMPFGKYRGHPIADVPSQYLEWLGEQQWPDALMRQMVREELQLRREVHRLRRLSVHSGGIMVAAGEVPLLRSLLDNGYRSLLPRSHPGTIKRLRHLMLRLQAQLEGLAAGVSEPSRPARRIELHEMPNSHAERKADRIERQGPAKSPTVTQRGTYQGQTRSGTR